MKPAVEVSITSWKKNVVKPGQEYGRVLLMPGTGYNCDRPLLYWSAQALVEAGWRIDRMNVRNASDDLSTVIPVPAVGDDIVAESEAPSVAEARAIIRAEQAGQSHAASSRYSGPAPLICAGTADPFYDQARANALTPHVHEYPDANHSIEVPGHWRRSLDYLKEVTASVAQYAATL